MLISQRKVINDQEIHKIEACTCIKLMYFGLTISGRKYRTPQQLHTNSYAIDLEAFKRTTLKRPFEVHFDNS